MSPTLWPRSPYTVTIAAGGVHLALTIVGAIFSTDPNVQAWNSFAKKDTRFRNIIFVGHAADMELGYLAKNPHIDFNPYSFATVGAIVDCQRLYDWLEPDPDTISLTNLIRYCFPNLDTNAVCPHNAGNDAIWQLKCCMELSRRLAVRHAAGGANPPVYEKVFDAIFVAVDVELLNARNDRITELGFASLDSRTIGTIHPNFYEQNITARHIIIKKNVPIKVNGVRKWTVARYGKANFDTDNFDPRYGPSREIWIDKVPRNVKDLFFVPKDGRQWDWVAPAGLRPNNDGNCVIQTSSPYWNTVVRKPW